jgi:hypothetical protein
MTTKNKIAYEAFTVRESKGKSYFRQIGIALTTKKGDGLMVYLDANPVNGKLILTPPKVKEEAPADTGTTVDDDGPYIDDEAVV